MATSKKLETIYYNGQPDGIRSIRRHLSTITTYVIPRSRSILNSSKYLLFSMFEPPWHALFKVRTSLSIPDVFYAYAKNKPR